MTTDATDNAVTTTTPEEAAPATEPATHEGGAARKPRRRGGRNNNNRGGRPEGQAQAAQGKDNSKAPAANKGGGDKQQQQQRKPPHPALEKLFELYPGLFGARFLPLKRGVYEELVERHPDAFKPEELKLAMGLHARSTRYLESVAAGHPRHDLEGNVVEAMAPEHVHHAILELHRRRLQRTPEDAQPALREQTVARIARAIEASELPREDYAVLVRSRDADINAIVDDALASLAAQTAKAEALLRAFEASGKTEQEFADMYGMNPGEVARTLKRARAAR
ncbi:ProQ/FINO family protein [Variovorax sp. OV329]|uniref:ProQ/FINO family protein n=1 Tax=Variovorax sp. OV329 TaxID=1882825 RepID=UPI0008E5105C|nr:ProQ/FINO family protein [Variovorax sp. OV329]SFM14448.1 ProQ/FINO family protein [Variovorax sp. OV329]